MKSKRKAWLRWPSTKGFKTPQKPNTYTYDFSPKLKIKLENNKIWERKKTKLNSNLMLLSEKNAQRICFYCYRTRQVIGELAWSQPHNQKKTKRQQLQAQHGPTVVWDGTRFLFFSFSTGITTQGSPWGRLKYIYLWSNVW